MLCSKLTTSLKQCTCGISVRASCSRLSCCYCISHPPLFSVLCAGVIKSFFEVVHKWLASSSKASSVDKLWELRMERLRPVKWFIARSVLKTGSWVAENYLCWAR